ncbi:MAG: phosphoribosyltransferase [Alphaproteobacteria bacterium]|nr:phosphoribosyltransferase [Alphaproteobacteria bacterium]
MQQRFKDRREAGAALASLLEGYAGKPDALVLALPRGGVPVAHEAARLLSLPMDIWLVRKLGVPGHEEMVMGAIAPGDVCRVNADVLRDMKVPQALFDNVIEREKAELARRNLLYRQGRPPPEVKGKAVIVIDDGLATGATMVAAVESLRQAEAAHIVAAAPLGSAEACGKMAVVADDVACLWRPEPFYGAGQWYEDFSQMPDAEVLRLMTLATGKTG